MAIAVGLPPDLPNRALTRPVAGTSSLTTASGYSEIIYARPRSVTLSVTRNF